MEERQTESGDMREQRPQIIHVNTPQTGRYTPLWLLFSVIIGFSLPMCACIALMGFSVMSMSFLPSVEDAPIASTGSGPAVAIVRVEGVITHDQDMFSTGAPSSVVMRDLKLAGEDDDVKAIVLRVDSPGGTVTGSAQIYEMLQDIEKPIVVSMGGVAASGGYYVSAPADYIIARPDTVTGSLGVIFTIMNAEELIDEIGVEVVNVTSGPNKSIGSMWQELTPEQEAIFQVLVDESYDEFVRIIVDGRGLSEGAVRELADGRIYSGSQAESHGLVDELGNFEDAVVKAAQLGGITGDPRRIEYDREPDLATLLSQFGVRVSQNEAEVAVEAINELTTPTLQYRYMGVGN